MPSLGSVLLVQLVVQVCRSAGRVCVVVFVRLAAVWMMETWAMRQFPWWGKTLLAIETPFYLEPKVSTVPVSKQMMQVFPAGYKEAGECLMCGHLKIIIGGKSRENSCHSQPPPAPMSNCPLIISSPTNLSDHPAHRIGFGHRIKFRFYFGKNCHNFLTQQALNQAE